jgi:hypothetical protein
MLCFLFGILGLWKNSLRVHIRCSFFFLLYVSEGFQQARIWS